MTAKHAPHTIPVVDVDQAFPSMTAAPSGPVPTTTLDQTPSVRSAIRNVLGVRSRTEDPKAFVDALTSAFRLVQVEGHTESRFVPRGYAIQADLGAVSGGQASLYRRAMIARTEILRIVDGLVPLRTEGDADDMEAYRVIVRNAIQSLVDELGSPGGPRVAMVDGYFTGLLGRGDKSPDQVTGQLGALRDRFGLTDDHVNTIEEEGRRTSFWTLVDLVRDLRSAWRSQRSRFGADGSGFLGTELIHISRLMEAATDQVEELEAVLDSVLVGANERRTITLDDRANLTLDGLLSWLTGFLHDEGRRLAQEAGRDGIVSALAPTAVELATTFKRNLADRVLADDRDREAGSPVLYLPVSCGAPLPPGMYAARVRVAVASLCRLLMELARRAMRIGRFAGVVLIDLTMSTVAGRGEEELVNVEFRGLNVRPTHELAFVPRKLRKREDEGGLVDIPVRKLVRPVRRTVTTDDESISALFRAEDLGPILREARVRAIPAEGLVFEAADFPCAIIDRELGRVIQAPQPATWPDLQRADRPRAPHTWSNLPEGTVAEKYVTPHPDAWWKAKQVYPPAAAERARAAMSHVQTSQSTLAEVAGRSRAEADRLAHDHARAQEELQIALVREQALRTEIADLEAKRDRVDGSRKSAVTRQLKPLLAEQAGMVAAIAELTVRADALAAESQEALRMASMLEQAHSSSRLVDDFVRDQLIAAEAAQRADQRADQQIDEHIDEEGH